jgi:hypothetical protein
VFRVHTAVRGLVGLAVLVAAIGILWMSLVSVLDGYDWQAGLFAAGGFSLVLWSARRLTTVQSRI